VNSQKKTAHETSFLRLNNAMNTRYTCAEIVSAKRYVKGVQLEDVLRKVTPTAPSFNKEKNMWSI